MEPLKESIGISYISSLTFTYTILLSYSFVTFILYHYHQHAKRERNEWYAIKSKGMYEINDTRKGTNQRNL